MTPAALSWMALPAAAQVATTAVQGGARLGSQFLQLLAGGADHASSQAASESTSATQLSDPTSARARSGDSTRDAMTDSWSQRFMQWLASHRSSATNGDLEVQLSLDQLDSPQIQVHGPDAAALQQAVQEDPNWLQEFRELAFDYAQAQGKSTPMTLKLSLQSAPIDSDKTMTGSDSSNRLQAQWVSA